MRILLVEDDEMLGRATRDGLSRDFAVDWFRTMGDATLALRTTEYELLILDLTLPDGSGVDLVRSMRAGQDTLPILILTARDAVKYRIEGLNAGADDYMVKPFDLDELIARCRALLRRSSGLVSSAIVLGNLTFNPQARTVSYRGQPVPMSRRELAVLECLISHRGQIVSRSQIENMLYDFSHDIESNAIEVHISAIRHKTSRDLIRTVRGVGYELAAG